MSRIFIYLLFHSIMDPGKGKLKKRSISLIIPTYNLWNKVSFDVIFYQFFSWKLLYVKDLKKGKLGFMHDKIPSLLPD